MLLKVFSIITKIIIVIYILVYLKKKVNIEHSNLNKIVLRWCALSKIKQIKKRCRFYDI